MWKRMLVDVLIVVAVYTGYRLVHAYAHFEWQHVVGSDKAVYAIPSFRK